VSLLSSGLPTPIKIDRLAFWLEGYDESLKQFLLDGFSSGFKLVFKGVPNNVVTRNLKSVINHEEIVDRHIEKEIEAGRFVGLFTTPPFQSFQCSPIGIVEKKVPGEFRMIHHLSYPEGKSINCGIPEDKCSVKYVTLDQAIHKVRSHCKTAFLAKTDVKKAFRVLPIHPDEHNLFCFSWRSAFFLDRALQMGCSASCHLFEIVSTAMEWIARCKLGIELVLI
jgi:hypothetical protein